MLKELVRRTAYRQRIVIADADQQRSNNLSVLGVHRFQLLSRNNAAITKPKPITINTVPVVVRLCELASSIIAPPIAKRLPITRSFMLVELMLTLVLSAAASRLPYWDRPAPDTGCPSLAAWLRKKQNEGHCNFSPLPYTNNDYSCACADARHREFAKFLGAE